MKVTVYGSTHGQRVPGWRCDNMIWVLHLYPHQPTGKISLWKAKGREWMRIGGCNPSPSYTLYYVYLHHILCVMYLCIIFCGVCIFASYSFCYLSLDQILSVMCLCIKFFMLCIFASYSVCYVYLQHILCLKYLCIIFCMLCMCPTNLYWEEQYGLIWLLLVEHSE